MVDDTAWIRLRDDLFQTESAIEDDAGEIRVQTASRYSAEGAGLGRLRSDLERPRGTIRYAHRNDAGSASLRMATKGTVARKAVWTIILRLDSRSQRSRNTKSNTSEMTADGMVALRARLPLLGERPARRTGLQDKAISGGILSFGEEMTSEDIIPQP